MERSEDERERRFRDARADGGKPARELAELAGVGEHVGEREERWLVHDEGRDAHPAGVSVKRCEASAKALSSRPLSLSDIRRGHHPPPRC